MKIDLDLIPDGTAICDGSCIKNPGPGGWAFALIRNGQISYKYGSSPQTTNNIMELTAMIMALKEKPKLIYTDSSYVVNGINEWMKKWKIFGWKNAQKEPVKNQELWQEIDLLCNPTIQVKWMRGHANYMDAPDLATSALIQVQNEVDELAREAAKSVV